MLSLLVRRAVVQRGLLAAVVAVVTAGATLLGVCALLVTTGQERSLLEWARDSPGRTDVVALSTGVAGADARAVADQAAGVVTEVLAGLDPATSLRASTAMRRLPEVDGGPRRLAYLSAVDDVGQRARLTSGRWPRAGAGDASSEAALPQDVAAQLGLEPGSRVVLGAEVGDAASAAERVEVVVVGTFRPLPDSGWDRDPLGGSGVDLAYRDGRAVEASSAYGPFLVDREQLFAGSSTLDRLDVTGRADLSGARGSDLDAVAAAIPVADARLSAVAGDRTQVARVTSDLPRELSAARTQLDATRSTVLVVVLLGIAMTAAALALAGRLVTSLRESESGLLSTFGASRRQTVGVATAEAAGVALVGALLAVPLSALAYAGLTRLPGPAAAGLTADVAIGGSQLAAVVAGAAMLAAVLVIPALRPAAAHSAGRPGRGLAARSGVDLLLVAFAVAGWWQLRGQSGAASGPDAVRVVAPVLCLLAGAVCALRLLPPGLRLAERAARRSRALVLPLAAFDAARRPQAAAAALLLSLATAAGTFALSVGETWERSSQDQADLRVGTDLALTLVSRQTGGEGAAVTAATGGSASPVTDRSVVVGRYVGERGRPPRLIAVDTGDAGAFLRGSGGSGPGWARIGAGLAPSGEVGGIGYDGSATVTLTGTATLGAALAATPRLVVQDAFGVRNSYLAAPVPLDMEAHDLVLPTSLPAGSRVVAVGLDYSAAPGGDVDQDPLGGQSIAEVEVRFRTPAPAPAPAPDAGWTATTAVGEFSTLLTDPDVVVTNAGGTTLVSSSVAVDLTAIEFESGQLVLAAFAAPDSIPVAVSQPLAQAIGVGPGDSVVLTVGLTPVPVTVTAVVPSVPAAPGAIALLADIDLLSRALITAADFAAPVDAWWVGDPDAQAATRTTELGLGAVTTRADVTDELVAGPLRIGLPVALTLLLPAVVVLVLAGTALHVTADVRSRALELARLRGLGVPRRDVRAGLLLQHGGVLILLVVIGGAVGAIASRVLATLLVRTDDGSAPLPAAQWHWPWVAQTSLLAGLVTGIAVVTTVVVSVQVRQADLRHLRAGA